MTVDRRALIAGVIGAGLAGPAFAQAPFPQSAVRGSGQVSPTRWPAPEHFALWPDKPPAAGATLPVHKEEFGGPADKPELWVRGIAVPTVSVYRPPHPDGRAVLSIPGGGYQFLSVENEGVRVARLLNQRDITVFVLEYRLPDEGWINPAVPLQDAQRAVRLIRSRAATWSIDPPRLGVMGFSAGGHLAGALATALNAKVYDAVDKADTQSARPAYAALVYPVMTAFGDELRTSPHASAKFIRAYDNLARLTRDTPPLFLLHAMDDPVVPVGQSIRTMEAAMKAHVPVEAHFLEHGGHGFGAMNLPPENPGAGWLGMFERWTRGR